ncbi:MAG: hypothetical protein EYC69_13940 [Bacteroidetes bacterium]|nr:MAG: hypothetical protein EYC69_13940 [Bacteroidota bacterium]
MLPNSTQNKLVLYAYNEVGLLEADQSQRLIDGDPLIEQEYKEMVEIINTLDKVRLEPSKECIERILAKA